MFVCVRKRERGGLVSERENERKSRSETYRGLKRGSKYLCAFERGGQEGVRVRLN